MTAWTCGQCGSVYELLFFAERSFASSSLPRLDSRLRYTSGIVGCHEPQNFSTQSSERLGIPERLARNSEEVWTPGVRFPRAPQTLSDLRSPVSRVYTYVPRVFLSSSKNSITCKWRDARRVGCDTPQCPHFPGRDPSYTACGIVRGSSQA